MIDWKSFFDQPVKIDLKTCDNIQKFATGQGDDYTTGSLLDYPYFKNYYKMIAIDLREKQQVFDADPKAIHQINFTGNLNQRGDETMLFIIKGGRETLFRFFARNCGRIVNMFHIISI